MIPAVDTRPVLVSIEDAVTSICMYFKNIGISEIFIPSVLALILGAIRFKVYRK